MELKPCPFCGEQFTEPHYLMTQGDKWGSAQCPACAACGPEVRTGYENPPADWCEDAIEAWNKRSGGRDA